MTLFCDGLLVALCVNSYIYNFLIIYLYALWLSAIFSTMRYVDGGQQQRKQQKKKKQHSIQFAKVCFRCARYVHTTNRQKQHIVAIQSFLHVYTYVRARCTNNNNNYNNIYYLFVILWWFSLTKRRRTELAFHILPFPSRVFFKYRRENGRSNLISRSHGTIYICSMFY